MYGPIDWRLPFQPLPIGGEEEDGGVILFAEWWAGEGFVANGGTGCSSDPVCFHHMCVKTGCVGAVLIIPS